MTRIVLVAVVVWVLRDRLRLVVVLAALQPHERDWMAAYLAAHLYARYADDETAHSALQKLYHRMHFGEWEMTP